VLIQEREAGLRLIPQHEHGLLSGELAAAWRGPGGDAGIAEEVVLATALHDLGWVELDEEPMRNPGTGRPRDFLDFPPRAKYGAAADAIERVAELHPYAGVLVSLHYTGSPGRPAEFEEIEEERRMELLAELGDEAPGPAGIRRDLEALRFFDNLSLFLCLTPPGADPSSAPGWLTPELLRPPGGGGPVKLEWRSDERAVVRPAVFGHDDLEVGVEYRDLPETSFASDEALEAAWEESEVERWRLVLAA